MFQNCQIHENENWSNILHRVKFCPVNFWLKRSFTNSSPSGKSHLRADAARRTWTRAAAAG
jgi:hypothetical protein